MSHEAKSPFKFEPRLFNVHQPHHRVLHMRINGDPHLVKVIHVEHMVVANMTWVDVQSFLRFMGWKDEWPEIKAGIEQTVRAHFEAGSRYYTLPDTVAFALAWIEHKAPVPFAAYDSMLRLGYLTRASYLSEGELAMGALAPHAARIFEVVAEQFGDQVKAQEMLDTFVAENVAANVKQVDHESDLN